MQDIKLERIWFRKRFRDEADLPKLLLLMEDVEFEPHGKPGTNSLQELIPVLILSDGGV
jgi:hypothetical protein